MPLPTRVRKAILVTHVVASVGWLGAVAAFAVLAIVAVRSHDAETVRSLTVAMEVLGTAGLVPLSLASFVSGVVQSLATSWGLFRHYWVIVKLAISVVATVVLLTYTATLQGLADVALAAGPVGDGELLPSWSPVLHSTAALVVLVLAVGLSVYKPKGLTPYGWRVQQAHRRDLPAVRN